MVDLQKNKKIILFDGVCNLCNDAVLKAIKYDRNNVFLFSSLQSEKGKEIISHLNTKTFEEKKVYEALILEEKIASGWVPPVKGARASKGKKDKLEVDPDAPRKPQGSFFLYVNKNRDMIRETYPEVQKHTEISKKAGELWKEMDDEAKKEFVDEANELKAQYDIDYAAYKESDAGKAFIAAAKVAEPKKRSVGVKARKASDGSGKQSTINFKSAETIEDSDDE